MADWRTEALALSPTVLYDFTEASGNLSDEVAGKTATITGSPTYGVSSGLAGLLGGVTIQSGSYFSVADHADLDLGNGPFSIEVWFKRGTDSDSGTILAKADASTTPGYIVQMASTDFVRLEDGSTSSHLTQASAATMNNTTLHHVVFTRPSASNGKCYIDGTDVTNVAGAKTFSDNANDLLIGRRTVGGSSYAGVTIHGLAIYKSELSGANVSTLYGSRNTAPTVTANAEHASATGASSAPAPAVKPNAEHASATGAAYQPAMPVFVDVDAGHAAADAWASQGEGSDLDLTPDAVTATGAAGTAIAAIGSHAEHASATGVAETADHAVGIPAGIASPNATAEAHDAIVEGTNQPALAEVATATGVAPDAAPGLSLPAGHASATGAASGIALAVAPAISASEATGAAQAASTGVSVMAGASVATASASTAASSVAVAAGHASATVSAEAVAIALAVHPELASAIGEAYAAQLALAVQAGLVSVTGAAYGVSGPFDWAHASSTVTLDRPSAATVTTSSSGSGVVTT